MSFIFKCPYCRQQLNAQDEWAGRQGKCTSCGKQITIQPPEVVKSYTQPNNNKHVGYGNQRSYLSIVTGEDLDNNNSSKTSKEDSNPSNGSWCVYLLEIGNDKIKKFGCCKNSYGVIYWMQENLWTAVCLFAFWITQAQIDAKSSRQNLRLWRQLLNFVEMIRKRQK